MNALLGSVGVVGTLLCPIEVVNILLVRGSVDGGIPELTGKALSLALKLRNRNTGINQTQTPKKVAISPKPGTRGIGRFPYGRRAACLASLVRREK